MSKFSMTDFYVMYLLRKEEMQQNLERLQRGELTYEERKILEQYEATGQFPHEKEGIIAILLILFFGSLGFMYVSFVAGLVLFVILTFSFFFIPIFGFLFVILMRFFMLLVGAHLVYQHNQRIRNVQYYVSLRNKQRHGEVVRTY